MTDAHAILRGLSKRGITVTAMAGDTLCLDGPVGDIPPDVQKYLCACKSGILDALTCPLCKGALASDEPETWWGRDRVHYACGLAAWEREWKETCH